MVVNSETLRQLLSFLAAPALVLGTADAETAQGFPAGCTSSSDMPLKSFGFFTSRMPESTAYPNHPTSLNAWPTTWRGATALGEWLAYWRSFGQP